MTSHFPEPDDENFKRQTQQLVDSVAQGRMPIPTIAEIHEALYPNLITQPLLCFEVHQFMSDSVPESELAASGLELVGQTSEQGMIKMYVKHNADSPVFKQRLLAHLRNTYLLMCENSTAVEPPKLTLSVMKSNLRDVTQWLAEELQLGMVRSHGVKQRLKCSDSDYVVHGCIFQAKAARLDYVAQRKAQAQAQERAEQAVLAVVTAAAAAAANPSEADNKANAIAVGSNSNATSSVKETVRAIQHRKEQILANAKNRNATGGTSATTATTTATTATATAPATTAPATTAPATATATVSKEVGTGVVSLVVPSAESAATAQSSKKQKKHERSSDDVKQDNNNNNNDAEEKGAKKSKKESATKETPASHSKVKGTLPTAKAAATRTPAELYNLATGFLNQCKLPPGCSKRFISDKGGWTVMDHVNRAAYNAATQDLRDEAVTRRSALIVLELDGTLQRFNQKKLSAELVDLTNAVMPPRQQQQQPATAGMTGEVAKEDGKSKKKNKKAGSGYSSYVQR